MLEHFGHAYGGRIPIFLRVNPHIMAGGHEHISTGHIDSKFGISIHQMRHVERIVASHGMHIHGLHMHTGSDILDADVFLRGAELLLETAALFPELRYLDLGSGFKVAYKDGDITTDMGVPSASASPNASCSSTVRGNIPWRSGSNRASSW